MCLPEPLLCGRPPFPLRSSDFINQVLKCGSPGLSCEKWPPAAPQLPFALAPAAVTKRVFFAPRPRSLAQYLVSAFYNTVVRGTALRTRIVNYGFTVCRTVRKFVKPAKMSSKTGNIYHFWNKLIKKKGEIMAFFSKLRVKSFKIIIKIRKTPEKSCKSLNPILPYRQ